MVKVDQTDTVKKRSLGATVKHYIRNRIVPLPGIRNTVGATRFWREQIVSAGWSISRSTHPSILHFSVNKAATQFTKSILHRAGRENGLMHLRLNEWAFYSERPYLDQLSKEEIKRYQHAFRTQGYYYGVFGGMVDGIPAIENYKCVLMVRDLRDVLVSDYFSMGVSHPVPLGHNKRSEFERRRQAARTLSLEEYVLSELPRFKAVMERYLTGFIELPNVGVFKYEDMINNFDVWLDGVLEICDLKTSSQLRDQLRAESRQATKRKEDVLRHARQATPGEHKRKLSADVINTLNRELADVLDKMGYSG